MWRPCSAHAHLQSETSSIFVKNCKRCLVLCIWTGPESVQQTLAVWKSIDKSGRIRYVHLQAWPGGPVLSSIPCLLVRSLQANQESGQAIKSPVVFESGGPEGSAGLPVSSARSRKVAYQEGQPGNLGLRALPSKLPRQHCAYQDESAAGVVAY